MTVREAEGSGLAIDFTNDIVPIVERCCVSCHGGDAPADGLAPAQGEDTWRCLVSDRSQSCVPEQLGHETGAGGSRLTFRRPQLTRYMRAFNARDSLLCWKAASRRTDGRTADTSGPEAPSPSGASTSAPTIRPRSLRRSSACSRAGSTSARPAARWSGSTTAAHAHLGSDGGGRCGHRPARRHGRLRAKPLAEVGGVAFEERDRQGLHWPTPSNGSASLPVWA